MSQQPLKETQPQVQAQVNSQVNPTSQTTTQFHPEDFDLAVNDFARVLAVYFTWKSAGLLDR